MSATILGMTRHGRNTLPLEYVAGLATALEADPRRLPVLALNESLRPEAVTVLVELLGPVITKNELEIIEVIRSAWNRTNPGVTEPVRQDLIALFGASQQSEPAGSCRPSPELGEGTAQLPPAKSQVFPPD